MHLLFVCTGNVCRSPTAERLLLARASHLRLDGVSASSAGTRAVVSSAIHPEAARVIAQQGGSTAAFTARQLTERLASQSDLVITMTKHHRDSVLSLAPRLLHRTFTLTEASLLCADAGTRSIGDLVDLRPSLNAWDLMDIPDPIGQPALFFTQVGEYIAELVLPLAEFCRRAEEEASPSDA